MRQRELCVNVNYFLKLNFCTFAVLNLYQNLSFLKMIEILIKYNSHVYNKKCQIFNNTNKFSSCVFLQIPQYIKYDFNNANSKNVGWTLQISCCEWNPNLINYNWNILRVVRQQNCFFVPKTCLSDFSSENKSFSWNIIYSTRIC